MKKFITVFLIFLLVLSIFPVFSATDELLTNEGFESGNLNSYIKMVDTTKGEVGSKYARTGSYGLKISNRKQAHATYCQDVTSIVKSLGQGVYQFSFWARLSDSSQPVANCFMVLRIITTDNKTEYITSKQTPLTTSWQQFSIKTVVGVENPSLIKQVYLYPQTPGNAPFPDIYVDDYSFKKIHDIEVGTVLDVSNVKRSDITTVGAIRWDAWYSHDGKTGSIISQVERSLSPARFHYRAPFYAEITGKDSLIIPEFTQEVFDREMEYAKYAGIDYFAYVWYNSDMKAARKFHTTSKYKNDVKMCVCFDGNAIKKDFARNEMRTLLKQDYYMTVLDGRPLMYYLTSGTNIYEIYEDIIYYRQLAEEIGVKEPYAVIMGDSTNVTKSISGDSVSDYAISGSGISFNKLTKLAYNNWEDLNDDNYQFVPTITAGWSPEPRYVNPVSWTTVINGRWCEDAKSIEIFNHLAQALSYMQHSNVKNQTKANTVIMYAWNEHDEGGWICPTLKVDKNGNQLYNSDGTKKLDETRINAVKLAIDFYKQGNLVSVSSGGISNGIDLPSASSLYDNIDFLLNTKVYEGISWKNLTIETQPTPNQTVQLPETTLQPVVTPTITPTDNINSTPASTIKPTATPNSEEPQAKFPWLIVIFVAVIINAVILPITVIIKRKNGGK